MVALAGPGGGNGVLTLVPLKRGGEDERPAESVQQCGRWRG